MLQFKVAEAILKKEPVTEITQLVKMGTIQQFANYFQNSMGTDDEEIDFRKKFQLERIRYSSRQIRETLRPKAA